jgi:hypothetical protein
MLEENTQQQIKRTLLEKNKDGEHQKTNQRLQVKLE